MTDNPWKKLALELRRREGRKLLAEALRAVRARRRVKPEDDEMLTRRPERA